MFSFYAVDQPLDSAYVYGVSITHGTPRNHIWTYAAGVLYQKEVTLLKPEIVHAVILVIPVTNSHHRLLVTTTTVNQVIQQ